MIYKFKDVSGNPINLELELNNEMFENPVLDLRLIVTVNDKELNILLDNKDVYHLIGALHLLQKEMK